MCDFRDPTTVGARVFIGNVAENTTREDVSKHFEKYGPIVGILLQRQFCFIQFEKDESAQAAIKACHYSIFMDRKITVRSATNNPAERKRNPYLGNGNSNVGANQANANTKNSNTDNVDKPRDGFGYFGGGTGLVNDAPPFKIFKPDHNDVEIIVVSKLITQYAEAIEAHLKRQGMSVDLLFPNDDVPIGKVLANISSRGTLYAILVTPQNAEMQSITVNILYGQPAEHRNMPVDDALTFILKNFTEKKRHDLQTQTLPTAVPITPVSKQHAPSLHERHPESIQNLLTLLADNRPLTVLQYDRIIQYLKERREMQLKVELGEGVVISRPIADAVNPISATSSTFSVAPVTPQPDPEEELQKKILDILNKPSIIPDIVPKAVVAEPSTGSTELLHDPKVQKALDSLLQGNLFNF